MIRRLFSRPQRLHQLSLAATLSLGALACSPSFAETETGYPSYPKINFAQCKNPEAAKKGEYLAKAGDCIACHTAPGGTPFAGGTKLEVPFLGKFHFTFYGPNLTPDKATGLGKWTDQQFVHAMQDGVSPHGLLYPAFPYLWFNRVKTEDVLAIKAYLDCLPPVNRPNEKPDMIFPFNIRFLQTGWRLFFFTFHRGQYQDNPAKSAQWNRGAYLVQGLGHCGMCHTPLNFLGGPKREYDLTGGAASGFLAPNISAGSLKNVPIQEIVDVFTKDQLIGSKKPGSLNIRAMLEVNHNSLQHLTRSDLEAIAIYLKSVESKQPPQPKISSGDAAGKDVYESTCYACHNTGAGGAPKLDDAAAWTTLTKNGLDSVYKNAIQGINGMPPKGTCVSCTDDQIKAAVRYMVDTAKGGGGQASASSKPAYPPLTMADGKRIYTETCAMCHDKGSEGAIKVGDMKAWQPLLSQGLDVVIEKTLQTHQGLILSRKSDADVIAAVKYMAQESTPPSEHKNYSLW